MDLFNLKGKTAVMLGVAGYSARQWLKVWRMPGRTWPYAICTEKAQVAADKAAARGIRAKAYKLNAMDIEELKSAAESITGISEIGILVNAVGSSMKAARHRTCFVL